MPHIFIGADIIVGFPGETEEEFDETVQLIEELPLSDLHVFPYSSRPGTKAAGMPGHIADRVVTERAARVRNIAAMKKKQFLERFTEITLNVLVHGYNDKTYECKGLSRNYISVCFPGEKAFLKEELSVLVTGSNGTIALGRSPVMADK